MGLTAAQATAELANVTNKEQLRALINRLDTSAPGSTTVLYSGMMQYQGKDTLNNSTIIQGMLNEGADIRVIGNTEAVKFLNVDPESPSKNEALIKKLQALFGDDGAEVGKHANRFQLLKTPEPGWRWVMN